MNLFIVESPNKMKKIKGYLGSGWDVMASVGHIRDLPEKSLGVDLVTFSPSYEVYPQKIEVVKKLIAAAQKADAIYLATDPDREGEAISWHLFEALSLKKLGKPVHRVTFHEITKGAIEKAIKSAGAIDMKLVAAQEARRVLDRLVGYEVSPRLGNKLSAGRVQSPALRIIVDREREIEAFKSTPFYDVLANVDHPFPWVATWNYAAYLQGEPRWTNKAIAEEIAKVSKLKVLSVDKRQRESRPPAPFTTSTLQQAASVKLKMSPEQTMETAQKLFAEANITYHRTDSQNFSDESIEKIREFLQSEKLSVADKPNKWKSKDGAQEAHEAIRPTDLSVREAGESSMEKALYRMIWERTMASQMPNAVFDVTTIQLESDVNVSLDGRPALFKVVGEVPTAQKGWMSLTDEAEVEKDEDAEGSQRLPPMKEGDTFDCKGRLAEKKTKPQGRFTEASLVKELEAQGIGRPSTYASILKNLKGRAYLTLNSKRQLEPTDRGCMLVDMLANQGFSFLKNDYTRHMEGRLDAIAAGKDGFKAVVSASYDVLKKEMDGLPENKREGGGSGGFTKEKTNAKCKCGGDIEVSDKAWNCATCKATVWKSIASRPISEEEAFNLLVGETLFLDGFTSKSKSKFSAEVTVVKGKTEFKFPPRS